MSRMEHNEPDIIIQKDNPETHSLGRKVRSISKKQLEQNFQPPPQNQAPQYPFTRRFNSASLLNAPSIQINGIHSRSFSHGRSQLSHLSVSPPTHHRPDYMHDLSLDPSSSSEVLFSTTNTVVFREFSTDLDRPVIRKTTNNASRRKARSIERDFGLTRLLFQHSKTQQLVCEPLSLEKDTIGHSISFIMADWNAQSLRNVLSTPDGANMLCEMQNFLQLAIIITEALDRIHRTSNIIHMDLKPENILLKHPVCANQDEAQSDATTQQPFQVKLIDFGISLVVSTKKPFVHMQNSTGSYHYMPPEQTGRTKAAVSFSSDIYSLGIIFYEILTGGKTPFHNETSPLQLLHAHLSKDAPVLQHIPANLWKIIAKMLQKDIKSRYQTAFGVLKDLRKLQSGALYDPLFVCGDADTLSIFRFPDELFGRSSDMERIENLVLKARERNSLQLILVTGQSGIGKSSLCARALSSALAKHCSEASIFVSSKYDQFQRGSVPFSMIAQVITKLLDIAFDSYEQEELNSLRSIILSKLGANLQLLTSFIPETKRLLGEEHQKATSLEDKNEQKERFLEVICLFLAAFGQHRTLCMFLDDVQWIDTHSLQVISKLLTIPETRIILFTAHRSNEVDETHILSMTLNEFKQKHMRYETLHLNPLRLADLNSFVAETLHLAAAECMSLSKMIFEKTEGNPFFARELLSCLHEQGVIFFDSQQSHWRWTEHNLQQVTTFSSNVVELMVHALHTKSELLQCILGHLAIIGSQFVLDELQFILPNHSREELSNAVFTLQQEGWIQEILDEGPDVKYKFAHDRFQQSSLQLIAEKERVRIHMSLGWRFLELNGGLDALGDVQIFQCVDHLNHGFEAIISGEDEQKKDLLLRLNYRAAVKALDTTAFEAAKNYANMAQKMLSTESWTNMHTKVYVALSDACFALSEHDEAERLLEMVSESCTDESEKYLAHSVLVNLLLGVYKADKAFTTTVERVFHAPDSIAFKYLGDMPITNDEAIFAWLKEKKTIIDAQLSTLAQHEDVEVLIRRKGEMDESLPVFALQKVLFQAMPMMVISPLASALHLSCLALSGLQCALDNGISIFTSFFLNWCSFTYAVIFKDFSKSVMFYHCGVRLLRSRELQSDEIMVASLNCLSFCSVFVGAPELVDSHEREGLLLAFDRCSYSWGAYFVVHSTTFQMAHGYPFSLMLHDAQTYRAFLTKGKALFYLDATECVWALARFLSGEDEKLTINFRTRSHEQYRNVRSIRLMIPMCEMIAKYMTDDVDGILLLAGDCAQYKKDLSGLPQQYLVDTFLGLVYAQALLKDPDSIPEKDAFIETYAKHISMLEGLKNANEKYFGCIFHLNKAEFLRSTAVRNDTTNATIMAQYNQAIRLGRENGNELILALSFELAGKFALHSAEYLEDSIALYFQSAAKLYMTLDATRKFNALRNDHPKFVYFSGRRKSSHALLAPVVENTPPMVQNRTVSSGDGSWLDLDLQSMMKLSQTISKEIDLHELMKKALDILVENVGAQRGFLFLLDDGELTLRAVANVGEHTTTICPNSTTADDVPYCNSVVRDVLNQSLRDTNQKHAVVVDNASQHREYAKDQNVMILGIKSMICAPIVYQNDTIGLVYCDHSRIEGCFGAEARTALFEYLLEQLGISIVNSRLYKHLSLTNEAYSRFVPNQFLNLLGARNVWDIQCGDARAMEMAVCFVDVRDWTKEVENLSPSEAFEFINSIWHVINPIVMNNSGIIDKVLGDCIMVLFPGEKACENAVLSAMEIMRVLNSKGDVRMGCGIHFGSVMLGTVGNHTRLDTTAISDVVNVAARLESITKAMKVDVILSEAVHAHLSSDLCDQLFPMGKFILKGKKTATRLFTLRVGEYADQFLEALSIFESGDPVKASFLFHPIELKHELSAYYWHLCDNYERLRIVENAIMLDKDGNAVLRETKHLPKLRIPFSKIPDSPRRTIPDSPRTPRTPRFSEFTPRGGEYQIRWNHETRSYDRVRVGLVLFDGKCADAQNEEIIDQSLVLAMNSFVRAIREFSRSDNFRTMSGESKSPLTSKTLTFESLCTSFFERLPTLKKSLLQKCWRQHPVFRSYDIFRLLLPTLDIRYYNVKEQKLVHILKKAWNLSKSHVEYLQQWRRDRKVSGGASDLDFGSVVAEVAQKMMLHTPGQRAKVSIHSLHELLDSMQQAARDASKHEQLWRRIGTNFSALEIKWLVRIILKDMRIGMQYQQVLKEFHPHALDLYNTCTNLEEVCEKCNDKNFVFSSLSIQIFKCIKPMLATVVPSVSKLAKKIASVDHVYEPKYDGERILIHVSKPRGSDEPKVMYFTRNSKDYTNIYGPKFDHVIREHVKSTACILDGEMMVWSNELQAFKEFGNNRTFALSSDNEKEQFCFCVFDIVVYNTVDISQKPLSDRRKYLLQCVDPKEHAIEIVPQTKLQTEQQALEALKEAVLNRDEGIMIKNTDSKYTPGDRKDAWMKLKPDHIDSMGETLDLIIIGGYWGTKFGRNSISHFLLAVRVKEDVYHTVAKVGSGYTNQELLQLQHALKPYWKTYQDCTETKRLFAGWAPQAGERPDVYINPKNSKVLEIKANSIVDSTKFKVGYTLRFPRVKRIRDDKNWDDACTLLEFKNLVRSLMNGGDATKRKRDASVVDFTMDQQSRKKRRLNSGSSSLEKSSKRSTLVTLSHFEDTDTTLLTHRSSIFLGKEIYVVNADSKIYTKQILETIIHENGGTKVQNATKNTSFLVAAKREEVKVRNWIKSCEEGTSPFDKDVVHFKYLIDCVRENKLLPLHPSYMIYTSKETQETFKDCIDKYGDAFTIDATPETFKNIEIENLSTLVTVEKFKRKYKIQLDNTFFRGCVMYLDRYEEIGQEPTRLEGSALDLIEAYVKIYSGETHLKPRNCTHIVVDDSDRSRWPQLLAKKSERCIMVRADWIHECVKYRKRISTERFEVRQ